MGVQIRRSLIATLVGLAVAIVIAAIGSLSAGRLEPIDPFQPLNPGIMGFWIGRLGWIPVIAALGAMFIGFKTSGVSVSIVSFLGALVGLVVVICVLVAVVAAAYPVGEFPMAAQGALRDDFVRGTVGSCVKALRARPENRAMSDADSEKYCRCLAEAMADRTKREDIAYEQKNGTLSPAMISAARQLAGTCGQALQK